MRLHCTLAHYLQYIPRNMHTVFALLCFVVVIHWLIFPYPSGLLHWHCGNLTIAPVPAKQPWWIWINTSREFIMNDCITTTKQSTTKPCAYFFGYTVGICYHWARGEWEGMQTVWPEINASIRLPIVTRSPFWYILAPVQRRMPILTTNSHIRLPKCWVNSHSQLWWAHIAYMFAFAQMRIRYVKMLNSPQRCGAHSLKLVLSHIIYVPIIWNHLNTHSHQNLSWKHWPIMPTFALNASIRQWGAYPLSIAQIYLEYLIPFFIKKIWWYQCSSGNKRCLYEYELESINGSKHTVTDFPWTPHLLPTPQLRYTN